MAENEPGGIDPEIETEEDNPPTPSENEHDSESPPVFVDPIERRNVTLRHAVGYLENSDTNALMKERESRKGVGAVMGRIGDRLRAGPFRRGAVMGAEDSERFHAIKEAVSDVCTGGDKLKKALGEGTTDIKNQKFDRDKIEMLVRYKEALRLSDEAVKLIREIPFVTEEKRIEIDNQLNDLHEHLMILAHEDSYKILYDFEKTITSKKRLSHRRLLGLISNPNFYQRPDESLTEYHDRVKPKKVTQTLKNVRVLYHDDAIPKDDGVKHRYEQVDLKNISPRPVSETEQDEWAIKHIEAEKRGIYKTRLEGPYTETLHALGSEGARDAVEKLYLFIDELTKKEEKEGRKSRLDEILKSAGISSIQVTETPSKDKFTFSEPSISRRDGGRSTPIPINPDKAITVKMENGQHHIFTIFFDGFIVPGKNGEKNTIVKQPPSAKPDINYSLRHTMFARTSGEKPISLSESTRILTNPDKNTINKSGRVYDVLKGGVDGVASEIEEEKAQGELEKERLRREREDVGRAVTDLSKQLIALCRKIPQDAISSPLITRLVDSATSVRENYYKALGAYPGKEFANSLRACLGDTRTIEQLLDVFNDSYGSDVSFSGRADLRDSIDNIGQIAQIFQGLLP